MLANHQKSEELFEHATVKSKIPSLHMSVIKLYDPRVKLALFLRNEYIVLDSVWFNSILVNI